MSSISLGLLLLAVACIVLVYGFGRFRVYPNNLKVVARLNQLARVARPGVHFAWPLVEQVSPNFPILHQSEEVINLLAPTTDNRTVYYHATVHFDVVGDDKQIIALLEDNCTAGPAAIRLHAERSINAQMTGLTSEQALRSLADITRAALPALKEGLAPWGLKVTDLFITKAFLTRQV